MRHTRKSFNFSKSKKALEPRPEGAGNDKFSQPFSGSLVVALVVARSLRSRLDLCVAKMTAQPRTKPGTRWARP